MSQQFLPPYISAQLDVSSRVDLVWDVRIPICQSESLNKREKGEEREEKSGSPQYDAQELEGLPSM